MAEKRPATDHATAANSKKLRLSDSSDRGVFRLLDLAPELRNNIYACVLQSDPQAYLTTSNGVDLFSKSALSRVNRQVREEFNSLLQTASPELVAEVKNFNFGHVITFLNRMDKRDLDTLPNTHRLSSGRRMIINLIITINPNKLDCGKLRRWLKRLQRPEKKGSTLLFEYKATVATADPAGWIASELSSFPFAPLHTVPSDVRETDKMALAFRALTHPTNVSQ